MQTTRHTPATLVAASVRHLLRQGRPAYSEGGGCVYRLPMPGQRTLSCAIGGLIPDEHYDIGLEGANAADLLHLIPGCDNASAALGNAANDIQKLHDGWAKRWSEGVYKDFPSSPQEALRKVDASAPGWREALPDGEVERFVAMISAPPPA